MKHLTKKTIIILLLFLIIGNVIAQNGQNKSPDDDCIDFAAYQIALDHLHEDPKFVDWVQLGDEIFSERDKVYKIFIGITWQSPYGDTYWISGILSYPKNCSTEMSWRLMNYSNSVNSQAILQKIPCSKTNAKPTMGPGKPYHRIKNKSQE